MQIIKKMLAVVIIATMLLCSVSVAADGYEDSIRKNISYFIENFEGRMALAMDDPDYIAPSVWFMYGPYSLGELDNAQYAGLMPVVADSAVYSEAGAGDIAKDIISAVMLGDAVRDSTVAALIALQQEDGSFVNGYGYSSATDTAWAATALQLAKADYNSEAVLDYLSAAQKSDGGFNDYGEVGNVDTTGMVMNALAVIDGSRSDAIEKKCVDYINSTLGDDGFYVGVGEYDSANSCSQAYAIIGLVCAGQSVPDSAVAALLSLMGENGGFWYDAASAAGQGWYSEPDYFSTYEGIMALCDLQYGNAFVKLAGGAQSETEISTAATTAATTAAQDETTATKGPDDVPTGNQPLNPLVFVALGAAVVLLLITQLPKFRKK